MVKMPKKGRGGNLSRSTKRAVAKKRAREDNDNDHNRREQESERIQERRQKSTMSVDIQNCSNNTSLDEDVMIPNENVLSLKTRASSKTELTLPLEEFVEVIKIS